MYGYMAAVNSAPITILKIREHLHLILQIIVMMDENIKTDTSVSAMSLGVYNG